MASAWIASRVSLDSLSFIVHLSVLVVSLYRLRIMSHVKETAYTALVRGNESVLSFLSDSDYASGFCEEDKFRL